jgi:hypothetical protein
MDKIELTDAEYQEFMDIVAGFHGRTVVGRKRKYGEVE